MDNFRYNACLHFVHISKVIQNHLRNELKRQCLNFTEFSVLVSLEHKGRQTIQELANNVSLTSGALTYILDKLENKLLLKRLPCIFDRRVIFIDVTDEGRDLLKCILPELDSLINERFGLLTMEDAENVQNMLQKIDQVKN